MENILPSAVFISPNELSRSIFLTEITLQPKLVRISLNFRSVHGYELYRILSGKISAFLLSFLFHDIYFIEKIIRL